MTIYPRYNSYRPIPFRVTPPQLQVDTPIANIAATSAISRTCDNPHPTPMPRQSKSKESRHIDRAGTENERMHANFPIRKAPTQLLPTRHAEYRYLAPDRGYGKGRFWGDGKVGKGKLGMK